MNAAFEAILTMLLREYSSERGFQFVISYPLSNKTDISPFPNLFGSLTKEITEKRYVKFDDIQIFAVIQTGVLFGACGTSFWLSHF